MAAGDYVVRRNNANTDTIANAGGDLTLIWDQAVANVGSGITHSSGVFSLGETGHFLIMYSDFIRCTHLGNARTSWETRINFAGADLIAGSCTGYIRGNNSLTEEFIVSGCAIVDVASTVGDGDEVFIHHLRNDGTTASPLPLRVTSRSGISIIKLDDSWGFGIYRSSAAVAGATTNNVATTMNIRTQDEQDSPFTRSTDSVDIASTNTIMALFTMRVATKSTTNRSESQIRLNINSGTIEPGSWGQVYGPRHQSSIEVAAVSGMCLLYPTSGDDVTLEQLSREVGNSIADTWEASLTLVELPSGAESCTMEATGGLCNEAIAQTFDWDTLPHIDTAAFTATAGNPNIDVDAADDYIVMANQGYTSNTGGNGLTRAVPSIQFRVQGSNNDHAGGTTYNRNSGTAEHGHMFTATLLDGVAQNDSLEVWNDSTFSQNTGTMLCENGAFSALRLGSLFAGGGGLGIPIAAYHHNHHNLDIG